VCVCVCVCVRVRKRTYRCVCVRACVRARVQCLSHIDLLHNTLQGATRGAVAVAAVTARSEKHHTRASQSLTSLSA